MTIARAWIALVLLLALPAQAAEFRAGGIKITLPWTKATPERATVGGGFMTLTNSGREADRLTSATLDISGSVEIHEMQLVNGVMMMRHNNPGIMLKPGASVTLKPFAHHLMFIGLKQPLVAGQTVKGTLVFEKAGTIAIEYAVVPLGSDGPAPPHKGH